jgi:hypothetical protein
METIYDNIWRQADEECYKHDYPNEYVNWHLETDNYKSYKKMYPVDIEFHRKCLASGITRYVCDSSVELAIKVELLLKAVKSDLPILPQHYLAVIKQMKQQHDLRYCGTTVSTTIQRTHDLKNLHVLEQKFTCLKRKRSKKHQNRLEDSEDY